MKKAILVGLGLVFALLSFGQRYDKNLTEKWKVGKENVVFGNRIIRLEGDNDSYGMTNVGYKTYDQVKAQIMVTAEKEMWDEEKKTRTLASTEEFNAGGLIYLYIKRLTINAGNLKNFTIILQDSIGNEIYRKELKADIPEVPSGDSLWWNLTVVSIPVKLEGSFLIYVIDSTDSKKFKFQRKI